MLRIRRERLTANIAEFPVLEDEEIFALGDFLQTFDCSVGEVVNYVDVCLEDANRVADFFGQSKEGGCGVDIGGDAEIGLLECD